MTAYQKDLSCRLILHVDVNKTVLMADKAQGSDLDAVVNGLLADRAWGRLQPDKQWASIGRLALDGPANDPQLMTYRSYVDDLLLPDVHKACEGAANANSQLKQRRRHLKRRFTESGQPGEMFRGVYNHLKQALRLPPDIAAKTEGMPIFEGGQRHILPSFFNLLLHLNEQEVQCMVVFRTFGVDIPEVAQEMSMFATGQHPCYPEVFMDGRDGRMDMRLSAPESFGVFHRDSGGSDGSMLMLGSPELVGCHDITDAQLQEATAKARTEPLRGFKAIDDALMHFLDQGTSVLALRDCYQYWSSCGEHASAGKLMVLDPKDDQTLQMFFDDNVEVDDAHIIDVRHVASGASIAFVDVIGRHICKVDPLQAILDAQYFVRAVHNCAHAIRAGLAAPPTDPLPGS